MIAVWNTVHIQACVSRDVACPKAGLTRKDIFELRIDRKIGSNV
jgi:hypothetical protein